MVYHLYYEKILGQKCLKQIKAFEPLKRNFVKI